MTTLKDIKKAVNAALKEKYPEMDVYGADTVEGYAKPSFFVYITQTFSEATKNAVHKNAEVEINFIQRSPDESQAMDFFSTMEGLFSHKLKAGNRQITTDSHESGFLGDNRNVPYYSFEVEFWSAIDKEKEDAVLMGGVDINEEVR